MKRAHDIAVSINPAAVPVVPQKPAPRQVDSGTAQVVNALFRELQAIFPAWKQAWPDNQALEAAKKSWIKGFMAAGINTIEQIRFGIERCRDEGGAFAPSVGQFIAWCAPTAEMIGLPDVGKAYREACHNAYPGADQRWSHPAVHHAACETGFYELRNLPEKDSRILFERAYGVTVRAVLDGKPLREIPKALPESVSVRTPEVGRAALAGLRAKVRGGEA